MVLAALAHANIDGLQAHFGNDVVVRNERSKHDLPRESFGRSWKKEDVEMQDLKEKKTLKYRWGCAKRHVVSHLDFSAEHVRFEFEIQAASGR